MLDDIFLAGGACAVVCSALLPAQSASRDQTKTESNDLELAPTLGLANTTQPVALLLLAPLWAFC